MIGTKRDELRKFLIEKSKGADRAIEEIMNRPPLDKKDPPLQEGEALFFSKKDGVVIERIMR